MVNMQMPKFLPTEVDKKKWEKKYGEEESQRLADLATSLALMTEEEHFDFLKNLYDYFKKEKENEI